MTLTGEHMFLAVLAAAVTVALILWRAPSLQAAYYRLNLVLNTLGIAVVFAGWGVGIALFAWGVATGSKELIYISFLPMVLGGAMYNLITRRHRTWWGLFGFNDSHERWRSFWDETRNLWGLAARPKPAPGGASQPPPPGGARPSRAGPARSFSMAFGGRSHAGASVLGPLIALAATRLASGQITVFPNALDFTIVVDPAANGQQPHLDGFRQNLIVRRHDGGFLQLAVRTDITFLHATAGYRRADGSYAITVGLIAERLTPGPFSGSLLIETGDPAEPQMTVPVSGTVA